VSVIVSAPGCFWIAMMTAGVPLSDPSPRLIVGPASMTVATSRTSTGPAAG
jgi:hypothetical protein